MGEKENASGAQVPCISLLADLGRMARRWRRACCGAGGACIQQQDMNMRADQARRDCAKELEAFIEANTERHAPSGAR